MASQTLADRLSNYVANLKYEDLPADVVHEAKRRLIDSLGCAMLVIEHDMLLITTISDRMLALELGRVIAEGTPDEVTSDPQVVSSYLGGDLAAINRSGAAAVAAAPKRRSRNGTGNGTGNGSDK